ncbi:Adenylyl-sulfate kinase [compost metagenome]
MNTSLEVCEQRDPKGLYKKARSGQLPNMTGISSPYEAPLNADISISTTRMGIEEALTFILAAMAARD